MSAIVSLSAYTVGTQLLFCPASSGCGWGRAAQSSSDCCCHGTAAFWHGIVQHFVAEISPFVTAGHGGGESNAAFEAEKSNSYVLGEFEIVGFSHVLWTSEVGCDFPPPRWSHFSLYESDIGFIILIWLLARVSLFFLLSSNCLCLVIVWPYRLLGTKDDMWAWK